MIHSDKYFQEIISKDELPFNTDPSAYNQLVKRIHSIALRSATRMNSLFTLKSIFQPLTGLKVAVACCFIVLFTGIKQINTNSGSIMNADSTNTKVLADTTSINVLADSIQTRL